MSVLTAPVTHQVLDLQKNESSSSATPVPQGRTQKIFGSRPCPNRIGQDSWLLVNPSWLTAWAVKTWLTLWVRGGTDDQSGLVVLDQPLSWFTVPAQILIQITSRVGRALDPSSHSILLSITCSPKHCVRLPHWSSASYGCNKPGARDKAAVQIRMPRNKPMPNIYSHSFNFLSPSTSRYSSIDSVPSDNTTHSPPPSQIDSSVPSPT